MLRSHFKVVEIKSIARNNSWRGHHILHDVHNSDVIIFFLIGVRELGVDLQRGELDQVLRGTLLRFRHRNQLGIEV